MFVEIDQHDLPTIIDFWHRMDEKVEFESIGDFFKTNARTLCQHPSFKHTLEPLLRRPHITIHAGAKDGAEHCREIIMESAYDAGRLTARNGFNLWYGGGLSGAMGGIIRGYNDELKLNGRRPDQYSIQVIPAPFVYGVESKNGLSPINEGLCDVTDAAIIMPDFTTRRTMLDDRSIAITCPGGTGSLDEWSDVVVHIKTGLRSGNIPLYTLNPFIPELGECYYDGLKHVIHNFARCGMENSSTLDHLNFKENAEQVFAHLMPKLALANALPDQVYAAYCKAHGVKAGIPKKTSKRASGLLVPAW